MMIFVKNDIDERGSNNFASNCKNDNYSDIVVSWMDISQEL